MTYKHVTHFFAAVIITIASFSLPADAVEQEATEELQEIKDYAGDSADLDNDGNAQIPDGSGNAEDQTDFSDIPDDINKSEIENTYAGEIRADENDIVYEVGDRVSATFDAETGTLIFHSQGGILGDQYWRDEISPIINDVKRIIVSEDSSVLYLPENASFLFAISSLESIDLSKIDSSLTTNMSYMFLQCENLTHLDLSSLNTENVNNMESMFAACISLESLDLAGVNTSHVTAMNNMFGQCETLTSLSLDGVDTSSVNDMSGMFFDTGLFELDLSGFDTSCVTDMSYMFGSCEALEKIDLSSFDTRKVISMAGMFSGCRSLEELNLESFNTSNVETMSSMFSNCQSLGKLQLDNFDTSKVTEMPYMFYSCYDLTDLSVSSFNTSKVSSMLYMFFGCRSLEEIDLDSFDTSNVYNMTGMFQDCRSLKKLDLKSFNTKNVTMMSVLFTNCSSLTELDISSFNTSRVQNIGRMFSSCYALKILDLSSFNLLNANVNGGIEDLLVGCRPDTIYTPAVMSNEEVPLPAEYYGEHGRIYTMLPKKAKESIKVTATYIPPEDSEEWYEKYTYTVLSERIVLKGYYGSETDIVVPGNAVIDGKSYQVQITKGLWPDARSIVFGRGVCFPDNCRSLFEFMQNLESVDLQAVDTSNVTDMSSMFSNCYSLRTILLGDMDTSNVEDMSNMFLWCNTLAELDLNSFETGKAKNMSQMFCGCSNLTSINVSGFNTSNVSDMERMFGSCENLRELDLSSFDLSSLVRFEGFLDYSCPETIKTPAVINNQIIRLMGTYVDTNRRAYTSLPRNLNESKEIYLLDTNFYAQIVSASVNFKGTIGLNIYIDIPEAFLEWDSYLEYTIYKETPETVRLQISDLEPAVINGRECRKVTVNTVVKSINDQITLHFYDWQGNKQDFLSASGKKITEEGFTYSVADYCDDIEEQSSNPKMRDLAYKLKQYGFYVQKYLKYKAGEVTPELDVSGVTVEMLEPYKGYRTEEVEGLSFSGFSFLFKEESAVRYRFKLSEGHSIDEYTFCVNGSAVTPALNGSQYVIEIGNIRARDLGKEYLVEVTNKEGNKQTLSYSGLSYAKALIEQGSTEEAKNAAKALYLYYKAAVMYFGS